MPANLRLHILNVGGYLLEIQRTLGCDPERGELFRVMLSLGYMEQSLARNTAGVETFAAKVLGILFDEQRLESQFGGRDRNVESGRAGSDDDQVVVHGSHASRSSVFRVADGVCGRQPRGQ